MRDSDIMKLELETWKGERIIHTKEYEYADPPARPRPFNMGLGANIVARGFAPTETDMRIIVLLAFLGIVASLVSAGVYLMQDRGSTNRMVYALTIRIGLSILLFLFMLLAWRLGWINATGIPVPVS